MIADSIRDSIDQFATAFAPTPVVKNQLVNSVVAIVEAATANEARLVAALESAVAALRSSAGPDEKMNAELEGKAVIALAKGGVR
jgi:hypothetical protein